jgi:ubiquitin carboxyl-terminal hydrolase L3
MEEKKTETGEKVPEWLPLESNPDVLTKLAHALGCSKEWSFTDVWGLDDEILDTQASMFAGPVLTVLFLFPSKEDNRSTPPSGTVVPAPESPLFFLEQVPSLGNACGTIAVVHALTNISKGPHKILSSGALENFASRTEKLTVGERGRLLAFDEEIRKLHDSCAHQGQTQTPSEEESVDFHFICFVMHDGRLFALDGLRPQGPIDKGPSSQPTFLKDCAKVIKEEWLSKNRAELRFSVIALTQLAEE